MHLNDPEFPPLFTGHGVRAPLRPFTEAVKGAADGKYEAGDLVWARNTRVMDIAIVLEPEVTRERGYEILCAGAVALSDALGAIAPPEIAITWTWPHIILANKARVGKLRLEFSPQTGDDGAPLWLVLGVEITISPDLAEPEPGLYVDRTTLYDEGCVELDRTMVMEAWSRHFLTWINTWSDEGFKPVHDAYLFRANGYREEIQMEFDGRQLSGTFIGLDDNGHMLLKTENGVEQLHMEKALRPGRRNAGEQGR